MPYYLLLVLCFVFLGACSNSNLPSQKLEKEQLSAPDYVAKKQADTTAQLKYTSMIRAILEDSQGNFWFGSDQEGVCRYDGTTFTYFDERNGLSNNQIRSIQEHKDGTIWLTTGEGISKYDGKRMSIPTEHTLNFLPQGIAGKWQKTPTDIWLGNGNQGGGVYRYDGLQLTFLKFPVLEKTHDSFSIPGPVTGVSLGQDNRVWIASYGGVLGYDGTSFLFVNERGIDYHVRSIFEDSKGGLWIGNNGIGILYYDGTRSINFTEKHGLDGKNKLGEDLFPPKGVLKHLFAIGEDRKGNIWFGDRDTGAWVYDGVSVTQYTTEDGLPRLFVRVIYTDKSGNLWVGTTDGGVAKFNGESFDEVF